jgi:rod shape-determining protein MreD
MASLVVRLSIATLASLSLTIIPLPDLFLGLRPPWVLMLILYLQCFLADYFSLVMVLLVGLILDVLLSTVLGEHAFALLFVTWIASKKARRFNFFSIGQQVVLIGFFCLLYKLIILMMDMFFNYHGSFVMPFISALISMLLWPWIKLIADDALLAVRSFKNSHLR